MERLNGVAFSGKYLLVQRASGALEVWDAISAQLLRTIPGDSDYEASPVANSQGTLSWLKRVTTEQLGLLILGQESR